MARALPSDQELAEARAEAVSASILAREAESKARRLRKTADELQAKYDDLLRERNYMTIDDYVDQEV